MILDRQARKLRMELGRNETLSTAALRSGMSENTARKWASGGLPSQSRRPRAYRTRTDPFEAVWGEVERLLEGAPGLEAVSIFEALRARPELVFSDGQVRTLQRRIRRWRASKGPAREVMFPQEHRAGEAAQSDFTSMNDLRVTISGEPFDHLFFHFMLPYSNWETGGICFSETFEALISGLQSALWELGRVPKVHRTDNLSAATHELADGKRAFNERYVGVLSHYGMSPDANTPGRGHENGDVEQSHFRFKRALEQALLFRGNRNFEDRPAYDRLLREILAGRNRGRGGKLSEELDRMRELPLMRLEDYRRETPTVGRFSTIRVAHNLYSLPSRLMGEKVDVRLYSERIEVRYAGELVGEMERLRGKGGADINYRHVIWTLVTKPGAFARYRYRECLFPTLTFRRAFDALEARHGSRADVEYVRILHLAAGTSEVEVEAVLAGLLDRGELIDYAQVRAATQPESIELPACTIDPPDLHSYDECLETLAGAR